MKTPIDYKPKYSLSIAILGEFMTKKELNELMRRYVEAKKNLWKKAIKNK